MGAGRSAGRVGSAGAPVPGPAAAGDQPQPPHSQDSICQLHVGGCSISGPAAGDNGVFRSQVGESGGMSWGQGGGVMHA